MESEKPVWLLRSRVCVLLMAGDESGPTGFAVGGRAVAAISPLGHRARLNVTGGGVAAWDKRSAQIGGGGGEAESVGKMCGLRRSGGYRRCWYFEEFVSR